MSGEARQVVVVRAEKNPGTAALLGCLFGPIGLLYSTVKGAIVMFIVNALVGVLTVGLGLLFTWPVCGIWGYMAAKRYNEGISGGAR